MRLIQQNPEKIVICMPANESLANAIRRSVWEVPTLAIDEVEFIKNDSALYDEILANRIGLIPLKTEQSMSEKTIIELSLTKTGPCMVYSGDIRGGAEVVYQNIPLTLLEKDQEIKIVATAKLGKGIEHEKYSPGLCYYRHLSIVDSKNFNVSRIIQNSKGLLSPEKTKEGVLCDLNESEIDEIEKLDPGCVRDSNEIVLVIESFGQMNAKEILLRTLHTIKENLKEFEKSLG